MTACCNETDTAQDTKVFVLTPLGNPTAAKAFVLTLPTHKVTPLPGGFIHVEMAADDYETHKKTLKEIGKITHAEHLS